MAAWVCMRGAHSSAYSRQYCRRAGARTNEVGSPPCACASQLHLDNFAGCVQHAMIKQACVGAVEGLGREPRGWRAATTRREVGPQRPERKGQNCNWKWLTKPSKGCYSTGQAAGGGCLDCKPAAAASPLPHSRPYRWAARSYRARSSCSCWVLRLRRVVCSSGYLFLYYQVNQLYPAALSKFACNQAFHLLPSPTPHPPTHPPAARAR